VNELVYHAYVQPLSQVASRSVQVTWEIQKTGCYTYAIHHRTYTTHALHKHQVTEILCKSTALDAGSYTLHPPHIHHTNCINAQTQ
jgi:hypothetical protein